MRLIFPLLSLSLLSTTAALPVRMHPDRVHSLSGAPSSPKFHLYSGYLNGSSNHESVPIFYLLAEAIRVDPSTAPLVVWFNGGPGGSSLYGFFMGIGPYRITDAPDVLKYNEFAWNQYANVLFLESPLGVGFSQNSEEEVSKDDGLAADVNVHAITDFMNRVHPNYANRDYFLSGQSYAGVYVPFLARNLLEEMDKGRMTIGKFKGFAIGNPTFVFDTSVVAEAMHLLNYGLLPDSITDHVLKCWIKIRKDEKLDENDVEKITDAIIEGIPDDVIDFGSPLWYNFNEHCYTEALFRNLSIENYHRPIESNSIACDGKTKLETYMNRADVQSAFNVVNNSFHTKNWHLISRKFRPPNFNRNYDVLPVYDQMLQFANSSSFRVLIYNGIVDSVKPPLHALQATAKIAKDNGLEKQKKKRAWKFYGEFAGTRTSYRRGNISIDVLTVRDAGHNVPLDLPAQAFQLINNFLFSEDIQDIDYSQPIRKH